MPEIIPPFPMLAIGAGDSTFTFSTGTAAYESLQRSTSWEWPAQARVGAYPAHQYTGPAAETITLPGVIYPAHRDAGAGRLDRLRALAAKGDPQPLADGSGNSLGRWVITSLTEDQSNFLPGGAPRKQTFTLNLTRYD
jgi:phage protein U